MSSGLYSVPMNARRMEEAVTDSLRLAADTVRVREEWLEEKRSERDAIIYGASQDGYSFGEIAEVTELARSTVALIVKLQTALRTKPVEGSDGD